jgi:hypothetical protein
MMIRYFVDRIQWRFAKINRTTACFAALPTCPIPHAPDLKTSRFHTFQFRARLSRFATA